MKRPTDELLDDLLGDSAMPEFRARLLDKTLQSARRRKRARRFNLALGACAVSGMVVLTVFELREPRNMANQIRQSPSSLVISQEPDRVQMVSSKADSIESTVSSDSASTLTVVQTSVSARPREIDDQQLLALFSDRPVALIHQGAHQAELIFPK
jgi:hypothetical protein